MFTWNLTGMQSRLFFPPRLAHNLCIFTGAQTCRLIIVGFLFRWQIFSRNFTSHLMKICIMRIMIVKIIIHICKLFKNGLMTACPRWGWGECHVYGTDMLKEDVSYICNVLLFKLLETNTTKY